LTPKKLCSTPPRPFVLWHWLSSSHDLLL